MRECRRPTVVVTGIGLVTGLGKDRETCWSALKAGQSAVRMLDGPRVPAGMPCAGCPAPGDWSDATLDEPVLQLLLFATLSAMTDARLPRGGGNPDRLAVLVGLSKGGLRSLARVHRTLLDPGRDQEELARDWFHYSWPHMGATYAAKWADARGTCLAPIAACATGLVAVLQAADMIRRGQCDTALAGAADASLEPVLLGAFHNMKALARLTANDDPARAVRPWDRNRRGFLVGEGAALFVLERADRARARGVLPYAEIAGGALGCDAYHMTDQNPDPAGLAHLIRLALDDADVPATAIDHVNVHGTATRSNDPLECRALRIALGTHADTVSCSANKAQIGHLLGAAGAVELAITCLAMRDGFVPPTLNLTDPDPACDLDGTPLVGRSRPIGAALKLSLGFGGHLAAAVLKRPDGPCRKAPADG